MATERQMQTKIEKLEEKHARLTEQAQGAWVELREARRDLAAARAINAAANGSGQAPPAKPGRGKKVGAPVPAPVTVGASDTHDEDE